MAQRPPPPPLPPRPSSYEYGNNRLPPPPPLPPRYPSNQPQHHQYPNAPFQHTKSYQHPPPPPLSSSRPNTVPYFPPPPGQESDPPAQSYQYQPSSPNLPPPPVQAQNHPPPGQSPSYYDYNQYNYQAPTMPPPASTTTWAQSNSYTSTYNTGQHTGSYPAPPPPATTSPPAHYGPPPPQTPPYLQSTPPAQPPLPPASYPPVVSHTIPTPPTAAPYETTSSYQTLPQWQQPAATSPANGHAISYTQAPPAQTYQQQTDSSTVAAPQPWQQAVSYPPPPLETSPVQQPPSNAFSLYPTPPQTHPYSPSTAALDTDSGLGVPSAQLQPRQSTPHLSQAVDYHTVPAPESTYDSPGYTISLDAISGLAAKLSALGVQPDDILISSSAPPSSAPPSSAPPSSAPPVDIDKPRPRVSMKASGPPLDVVPYCPEGRVIDYAMPWYKVQSMPDFLTCTRCYEENVKDTALASQFERIEQPSGSSSSCGFWRPRVRKVIWPAAVRSNSIDGFLTYIQKRPEMKDCKGRVFATGDEGFKWFGMVDSDINGFVSCEACYEDHIVGTNFAPKFAPYQREHPKDEKWSCDVSLRYVTRALGKLSERNDWAGFIESVTRRLQAPVCEGMVVNASAVTWYIPRRMIEKFHVCEPCYLDNVALTPLEKDFEKRVVGTDIDSFIFNIGETFTCKLTEKNMAMLVAREIAVEYRDSSILFNAAEVICALPACTRHGIVRGNWWTIPGCSNYDVCESCHAGIVKPCGLDPFFELTKTADEATLICNFCADSPRYGQFMAKLAEALDRGVFSYYSDVVSKFSNVPVCPGLKTYAKGRWWGYAEAVFCHDCYLTFVGNTPLADSLPIKDLVDDRPMICQIWSKRMRKMWLEVCAAGPPGSSESDARLDEFREFAKKRQEIYLQTVPQIDMIRQMKQMKMESAMNQGMLSVMYSGMNSFASVSGTTDGYSHGNSQLGWYDTEYGAQGAQNFANMQSGFASANRVDEWMQMAQLQAVWEQVE